MKLLRIILPIGLLIGLVDDGAAQRPAGSTFDVCSILGPAPVIDVKGTPEELVRLAEVTGVIEPQAVTVRRPSSRWDVCVRGDSLAPPALLDLGPARLFLAPLRTDVALNGTYPDDRGNGLMWEGRGLSSLASGGVVVRAGPVSAGWLPELAYQQNLDFRIRERSVPGYSEYANPFYLTIDLPQRFGEGADLKASLAGQSFARIDVFGFAAGISHENILVGPSHRNQILMSATASGFTHLFVGTARPLDLWIADVDLQLIMGKLEESDYFDSVEENDRNALALWTLSVRPHVLEGLEVGAARAYMYRPEEPGSFGDLGGLGGFFVASSESNLPGNELASIFARWVFVESGAEIYGEWARDDRWGTDFFRDFLPEPDHSQAYTIGLQKRTDVGSGALLVKAELTALQEKQEERSGRPLPVFYTHSAIRQGYTHRGQLLGAPIGPGADAQFVGVDWLDDWGYAGAFIERVRRNDASQAALEARYNWPYEHDTELTTGVRGLLLWRNLTISGTLALATRWDRDFLEDDQSLKAQLEVVAWPVDWLGRR